MEQTWDVPGFIRDRFPEWGGVIGSIVRVARDTAFGEQVVLGELKPLCLKLLYSTLPLHCVEVGCPLSRSCTYADEAPIVGPLAAQMATANPTVKQPMLVMSYGSAEAPVMFVGEAPGAAERCTGIPIVGAEEVKDTKCVECKNFEECFGTVLQ